MELTPFSGARYVADSAKFLGESALKRYAGVAVMINEEKEFMSELSQFGGRRKSLVGEGSRIATSASGLTTQFELSEMSENVGYGRPTVHNDVPLFGETSLDIELPPGKKLVGKAIVCHQSKYYPSQSSKTLRKKFFSLS